MWNKSNQTHNEYAYVFFFGLRSFISWSWFFSIFYLQCYWRCNRITSWPQRSLSNSSFTFFLSTYILVLWSTAPYIRFSYSTRLFSVTPSAISNASSILLYNLKQSWAMENTCSSWFRMIWAQNAFASKHFWWANCDVVAFAFSICPWREVFRARRQSLSIVIFCTILSRETIPLAALH